MLLELPTRNGVPGLDPDPDRADPSPRSKSRPFPFPFGLPPGACVIEGECNPLGGGLAGIGAVTGFWIQATTQRSWSPASGFATPDLEVEDVEDNSTCAGGAGRVYRA